MWNMTTTLSERTPQSALDTTRLRVVLLVEVNEGQQHQFLEAYEGLRHQVAGVPGHVTDQLCQSIEDPSQWLITSEWESAPPFLAWVESPEHMEMVKPLHGCVRDTRSLRFSIMRETGFAPPPERQRGRLQSAPRVGDGVVRHALTFTVKPGSEPKVAKILAGYTAPEARVDDRTRLLRTSLFMHGNRVVRAVEIKGDLIAAMRHVAQQPEVRAVEEAINPYLEADRDLTDPESARVFFTQAALPSVHHMPAAGKTGTVKRHALLYPVKPGCGLAAARLLARHDELAGGDPESPVASSTIFLRGDILVRMVDMRAQLEQVPVLTAGVNGTRTAAVLGRLLELSDSRVLTTPDGLRRFLASCDMNLITDRRPPEES
jgi:heme-degrading monooxygenase HmoA